jgi:hypothetical protein
MVTWDCPKMEVLGKGYSFLDTQFWNENRWSYFVVETTNYVLEIPQIYLLISFHFNKT